MYITLSPEQLNAMKRMMGQNIKTTPYRPLSKRLQHYIPLMDEVVEEVREKLNAPKKRTDFSKIVDEVSKEMRAGKG